MFDETANDEILLRYKNYPSKYVNKAHTEYYVYHDDHIRELLFNINGHCTRLLIRVSYKLNEKYVPITCIYDTEAPIVLYLSQKARNILRERIKCDEINNEYMSIFINITLIKMGVKSTHSYIGEESNLIELSLLNLLGLSIDNGAFELNNLDKFM